MTIETEILQSITSSLTEKPQPQTTKDSAVLKTKILQLRSADASMVNLPKICDEILVYIDKQAAVRQVGDRLDSFETALNSLAVKIDSDIATLKQIDAQQKKRIDQFNLLEAKYARMIERVNNVLDSLERCIAKYL